MRVNVDVHHLARIEGHGDIVIRVEEGQLVEARWDVVEAPRFFEAMLIGKDALAASQLTARICGICSIGHALASLEATEEAFGVTVPPQARRLRLLAKHGETLQSHALHVFFLAAPDFLDVPSVLPLLDSRPDVVALATRLRAFGNRLSTAVAGRTTHPVTLRPGGVSVLPDPEVLRSLLAELPSRRADLETAVGLASHFSFPDFTRDTELVSLAGGPGYTWIGKRVVSSDGVDRPTSDYRALTNEWLAPGNTSKWCKLSRDSFAVGALARYVNNHAWLKPEARRVASALGLQPSCRNPFLTTAAQLVEMMDVLVDCGRLLEETLDEPDGEGLCAKVTPRAGSGVGAVEVPRGILYHAYTYDAAGRITAADCVIPTTQNNLNIHKDLEALVRARAPLAGAAELERLGSMLVRAYDPCVSCSVH
jgi:sulfhydrogenase subunit alpha